MVILLLFEQEVEKETRTKRRIKRRIKRRASRNQKKRVWEDAKEGKEKGSGCTNKVMVMGLN